MHQQIKSFVGEDGNGHAHTIQVVQVFRVVRGPESTPAAGRSVCALETTEGERVARLQRGVYRLFPSGRVVRSHDPEAF